MSHLGRPDGQVKPEFSLKVVVPELEKLLGTKVEFAPDCVGPEVEEIVNKATGGQVVLLENLRFHVEEEGKGVDADGNKVKADKEKVTEFRKGLTALGDIYISESSGDGTWAHWENTADNWIQTMPLELPTAVTAQWSALICLRKLQVSS